MAATAQQFGGRYLPCCKFPPEFVQPWLCCCRARRRRRRTFPF